MESSTTIYHNAVVLTMNEALQLRCAESIPTAVAVKGDRIAGIGDLEKLKRSFPTANLRDLGGKTLMPSFFDPHTHLFSVVLAQGTANLQPPPIGKIDSIPKIQASLLEFKKAKNIKPGEWVVGCRYDHNGLVEQRHPTRDDIDEILPENPVLLFHLTMHYAVVNSKALEIANVDEHVSDPVGGRIVRYPGSTKPNGVLEEMPAVSRFWQYIPAEAVGFTEEAFEQAFALYASHGITTVQEPSPAASWCFKVLEPLITRKRLPIDVILYPLAELAIRNDFENFEKYKSYHNGLRFGGVKFLLDGSIQGRTACLTEPYFTSEGGGSEPEYGFMLYDDQSDLDRLFELCFKNRRHILAHANGDATADRILRAVRRSVSLLPQGLMKDHRMTIIHGQTLRRDQLEAAKSLGVGVSFFPGHAFYWGDNHIKTYLGMERASYLNPVNDALKLGLAVTIHNDCTVTPMSLFDVVYFAANRYTQSGIHLGSDQEISVKEALKAVTISSAWQHLEEKDKGSLEVGKLADMIIVSENPLEIAKQRLRDIRVLETIKSGRTIFRRNSETASNL